MSRVTRNMFASVKENAVLGGEPRDPLNAKVSSRLKKAVYDFSHLTRDPDGMSGVVRKALVHYMQDFVANINSPDPEWTELRDEIWYERATQARLRADAQQEVDAENAAGVARKLTRLRDRADYDGMLTYIEQVLEDVSKLSEGRRTDVMEALRHEPVVRDTMDRLDREVTFSE